MNLLPVFISLSALFHLWADHHQKNILSMIFKPLTMVLIILIVFERGIPLQDYATFILWGLIFSLIGDMMLLKPWYKFEWGLGSFLIGHVFYVIAFTRVGGVKWDILPLLPFIAFCLWLYRNIDPNLGRVKFPVIAYMTVILVMMWQGMGIRLEDNPQFGMYVAVGAFIFYVSDSLLAYQKFKQPIKYGNILVLSTYYVAQYLLAKSSLIIGVN